MFPSDYNILRVVSRILVVPLVSHLLILLTFSVSFFQILNGNCWRLGTPELVSIAQTAAAIGGFLFVGGVYDLQDVANVPTLDFQSFFVVEGVSAGSDCGPVWVVAVYNQNLA